MLYQAYEMLYKASAPYRAAALWGQFLWRSRLNPMPDSFISSYMAAYCDVVEVLTRRYDKPQWRLSSPEIEEGKKATLRIKTVYEKAFCHLLHFKRSHSILKTRNDPKVLVVAPMAGHFATLLRGTVEALMVDHDVYITDWLDARHVSIFDGPFDLEDYIAYIMEFIAFLGPDIHIVAVCQPGPAVLAAVSLMAEDDHPAKPASMTFMGSPIDTRKSPTVPNDLATQRPIEWFEQNVIHTVPAPYHGMMRRVYPGFLQLTGFMSMNLERHYKAHMQLFENLVVNDGDSVEKHREFYDEYLAVMDLTADFYLQTIKTVFQDCALPKGEMMWRGRKVNPAAISKTALMTVEGKKDDISGVGQTRAAHTICKNIPKEKKEIYLHPNVGHYGIFNGSKWRNEIKPELAAFFRKNPKAV
ncbi:MAG: polyhydroxyalkanoate depolymerase [Pseudomonadota bacterium]